MDSYRHITVEEPALKEGDRYNLHFDRFALNPLAFDLGTEAAGDAVDGKVPLRFKGAAHDFAERVDALVERFVTADKLPIRKGIAGELVSLHGRGLLLWPLVLMFGLTRLGKVGKTLIPDTICAGHPDLVAIRKAFEDGVHAGGSRCARQRQIHMWNFVVGLRFASTTRIAGPGDFRAHHLQLMAGMARPDGTLDPRLPKHVASALGHLAEHYRHCSDEFDNVTFVCRKGGSGRPAGDPSPAPWLAVAWREWMADKDIGDRRH